MLKNLGGKGVKGIAKFVANCYLRGIITFIVFIAGLVGGVSAIKKVNDYKHQIKTCIMVVTVAGFVGGVWLKVISIMRDINDYGLKYFLSEVNSIYIVPTVVFTAIAFYTYKLIKSFKCKDGESNKLVLAIVEFAVLWLLVIKGIMAESLVFASFVIMLYPIIKYLAVKRLPLVVGYVQENSGEIAGMLDNLGQGVENAITNVTNNTNVTDNSNINNNGESIDTTEAEVTLAMDIADNIPNYECESQSKNVSSDSNVSVTHGVAKTSNGSLLSIFRNVAPKRKAPQRKVITPKLHQSIKDILKDIEY